MTRQGQRSQISRPESASRAVTEAPPNGGQKSLCGRGGPDHIGACASAHVPASPIRRRHDRQHAQRRGRRRRLRLQSPGPGLGRRGGDATKPPPAICAPGAPTTPRRPLPAVSAGMADDSRSIVDAAAAHARTLSPGIDLSYEHRARPGGLRAYCGLPARRHRRRRRPRPRSAQGGPARVDVHAARGLRLVPRRRGEGAPGRHGGPRGVVVGVDGSDLSTEATGYAFEQASATRPWSDRAARVERQRVRERGRAECARRNRGASSWPSRSVITSEAIARWAAKFPNVDVRTHVMQGRPADVLVDASAGSRARRRGQPRTGRLPRPAPRIRQPQRPAPGALPGRRRPAVLPETPTTPTTPTTPSTLTRPRPPHRSASADPTPGGQT